MAAGGRRRAAGHARGQSPAARSRLCLWHARCYSRSPMTEKRTPSEMVGDYLREIAVLVMVFVPLDAVFSRVLTLRLLLATLVISGVFLAGGIWVEVKRP